jgi:CII-binding regulator of phage lambda lysogenization HflD
MIDDETFTELYTGYKNDLKNCETAIEQAEEKLSEVDRNKTNAEHFKEIIKQYSEVTELTVEILHDLIEKIVVHESENYPDKHHKKQKIEIHYRFVGKICEVFLPL